MAAKAVLHRADRSICVDAEQHFAAARNPQQRDVEILRFAEWTNCLDEANSAGVSSVAAIVAYGAARHINHGADISGVRSRP